MLKALIHHINHYSTEHL